MEWKNGTLRDVGIAERAVDSFVNSLLVSFLLHFPKELS